MIQLLLLIVLGFLGSALFSGVETGSYAINRIRLRRRERDGRRSAVMLSRVLRFPYLFIYTVLICNNITNYMVSTGVTQFYMESGMKETRMVLGFIPWSAETAATLTLMLPLFLFAELWPKTIFRRKADSLMYKLAGPLRLMVLLLFPVTWPLKQLFRFLTHGADGAAGRDLHRLSPEALREYFSAGAKDGVITSHQNRMLENVTTMHRTRIREVMTPFRQIPSLDEEATVADFKRLVRQYRTSYAIIVQRHRVIGYVSLFTVVSRKLGDQAQLLPYVDDVLLLAENRNLKSAFYRLRRNPHKCAVVVDGRGHPAGFIRLEAVARYIAKR